MLDTKVCVCTMYNVHMYVYYTSCTSTFIRRRARAQDNSRHQLQREHLPTAVKVMAMPLVLPASAAGTELLI